MEKLFEYIAKESGAISQAPLTFLILAAIMFYLAYLAAKWRFNAIIEQVKASNETLNERLYLKTEQAESYKDRALKYDEKAHKIVDSSEVALKEKTLEFVRNLRGFIVRHKREDDRVSSEEQGAIRKAGSEEEKSELGINTLTRLCGYQMSGTPNMIVCLKLTQCY